MQAADFSPVITNIHLFQPISQLQGFGFSSVTGFPRTFYLRQAEPAPIEMGNSECGDFGELSRAVRNTDWGCSWLSHSVPSPIFLGGAGMGGEWMADYGIISTFSRGRIVVK